MSRIALLTFTTLLISTPAAVAADDEAAATLRAQKDAAAVRWAQLESGEPGQTETARLLVLAPKALDGRLKEIAALLEKGYDHAAKALQLDAKEPPWPGKLTVYLLPERDQFTAFVRRVEKRRLVGGETIRFQVDDDRPHAAAGPGRTAQDPPVEARAVEAVAAALLQRKAGARVPLPGWLPQGFGRATFYQAQPRDRLVTAERRRAAELVTKQRRSAVEVWGDGLEEDEGRVLAASLAEFLAYGPGRSKFTEFVKGFEPGENGEPKTTPQALEAAGLKAAVVASTWRTWVPKQR